MLRDVWPTECSKNGSVCRGALLVETQDSFTDRSMIAGLEISEERRNYFVSTGTCFVGNGVTSNIRIALAGLCSPKRAARPVIVLKSRNSILQNKIEKNPVEKTVNSTHFFYFIYFFKMNTCTIGLQLLSIAPSIVCNSPHSNTCAPRC